MTTFENDTINNIVKSFLVIKKKIKKKKSFLVNCTQNGSFILNYPNVQLTEITLFLLILPNA